MKLRYRYRIYPTANQKTAISKLLGCVRVVYNDALSHCQSVYQNGGKKPRCSELQKEFITLAKKKEEREWLSEVSNIPLQQSVFLSEQ